MRFEISRLESDPRVACGVTLVESIGSKLLPVFPNLVQRLFRVSVLRSALVEKRLQLIHLGHKLLAHGLS